MFLESMYTAVSARILRSALHLRSSLAESGGIMATAKLSRDLIRTLAPAEKTYEVRDSDLSGLILRVYRTGRMMYVCQFTRNRRVNIGRADVLAPSEAREKARAIIADYARGVDPLEEKRQEKTPTLREFLEGEYGEWAETHYSDGEATVKRLTANFADLLDSRLDEITPWLIEKWRTKRTKAGAKTATLNRQLNPLKAMMNRAVEWGRIPANPLAGAVKLKTVDSKAKVRYLSDEEEARLRAALDAREGKLHARRASANAWRAERGYKLLPSLAGGFSDHLKPLVLLSLNTGMRRGETFNLAWSDVDLGMRMLTVRGEGAKSGQTRHIPLNDEAFKVLKSWKRTGTGAGLVFPGEHGERMTSIRTAWAKVLTDAKVSDFRWHDLRHTFASRLVMAGVDLNTVRELMGHADLKMTIRYAHLAPHVKADAVARLNRTA